MSALWDWDPPAICPLCGGGETDGAEDCELCHGAGILDYEDARQPLPPFARCQECGGEVETRDGSDGRKAAHYCDGCGLLKYTEG